MSEDRSTYICAYVDDVLLVGPNDAYSSPPTHSIFPWTLGTRNSSRLRPHARTELKDTIKQEVLSKYRTEGTLEYEELADAVSDGLA